MDTFKYVVINKDGTYVGLPCLRYEEARELANQQEDRQIFKITS